MVDGEPARQRFGGGAEEAEHLLPLRMSGSKNPDHLFGLKSLADRGGVNPEERAARIAVIAGPGLPPSQARAAGSIAGLELCRKRVPEAKDRRRDGAEGSVGDWGLRHASNVGGGAGRLHPRHLSLPRPLANLEMPLWLASFTLSIGGDPLSSDTRRSGSSWASGRQVIA